jgi:hypothetical protein
VTPGVAGLRPDALVPRMPGWSARLPAAAGAPIAGGYRGVAPSEPPASADLGPPLAARSRCSPVPSAGGRPLVGVVVSGGGWWLPSPSVAPSRAPWCWVVCPWPLWRLPVALALPDAPGKAAIRARGQSGSESPTAVLSPLRC